VKVIWLADVGSPHVVRWSEALYEQGISIKFYSLHKRRPRFFYLYDLIHILAELRKEPNTIVHAHFVSSYGVIASFLPLRFPKIISVWGSDVLVTAKMNWLYILLVRRALNKANIRIANSEYLASEASKIADLTYETISFGLPLENFPFRLHDFALKDKKPFVLGVAKRLHNVAGIDLLLEAFAKLKLELADIELKLMIAGSGPEEFRLKSLSRKLGIENSVRWMGWCGSEEISELYRGAHLAVFPSRTEGLGVAVIEAMACGVPVLGATEGGLVELIGEEQTRGLLFETDQETLISQIKYSIFNYEALVVKAKSAREHVEREYDIRSNASELIDIYKKLI